MENLPICYKYANIINPEKKFCLEKYIIFTSKFQLNIMTKCTQLHIDGTFKSCPCGYYQILIIEGYFEDNDCLIPIFIKPTTSKSEYVYNLIFEEVIKILNDNKIKLKNIEKTYND